MKKKRNFFFDVIMPEVLGKYFTRSDQGEVDEVRIEEEEIDWDPELSWAAGDDSAINEMDIVNIDAPSTSKTSIRLHTDPCQPSTSKILYCICQQEDDKLTPMIACDSGICQIEWYHMTCVGLTKIPEKQWICEKCKM